MVVNDLNPFWTSFAPPEADTPLIIDSDTVLSSTITAQTLEAVTRRNPEVFQTARGVNPTQPAQRNAEGSRLLPLTSAGANTPQFTSAHEFPFLRRGVDE